ncbi:MAG: division/cell wall cluster transcriptional repressor MraZ [Armatimonadota bacterium]
MSGQGASLSQVDASGRISLRDYQLDELEDTVILAQGFDRSILMFTEAQWNKFSQALVPEEEEEIDPDLDDLRRLFLGNKAEVDIDDRGRLKIPEGLREWARLMPGSSRVMVLNIGTRFEIWEVGHYQEYMAARAPELKLIARERTRRRRGEEAEGRDR